jgi:hypothetical protein
LTNIKENESELGLEYVSKKNKGKYIIYVEPTTTNMTTKKQPEELEEPKEEKHLFHSQMWMNGTTLHLILDNGSQKKLI